VSRRDIAILAAIVAIGAWLRAPLLSEGLWRDEASTYYDVAARGLVDSLAMIVRIELAPPAYFLVEKAWAYVAGVGPVALKLPSFIYGLALIIVVYALGRAVASPAVGLVAALFACVSQPAIDLSAEARVYEFSALFAALTLTSYAIAFRAARPQAALGWFAGFGIVLAYSNYAGSVLLGLLFLATVFVRLRRGDFGRVWGFLVACVVIAVVYLPWLPIMLAHARIGAPFQEQTRLDTFFDIVNKDFGHLLPLASRHGQIGIAFAIGALVCLFLAFVGRRRGELPSRPGVVTILALCTVGGAVVEALLSLREPRYIFVFAPGAWAWFAWLTCRFGAWLWRATTWQKTIAAVVFVGLVALFVPSERLARDEGPIVSSGIRDLAPAAIALQHAHRTLFLAVPDYLAPTFGYYVGRVTGAPVYGFARWNDPQIFVTSGYLAVWTNPVALLTAEARIEGMMDGQYDRLCLLRDTILIDRAKMPYTRANALIAWIHKRYRPISSAVYPGRFENVAMEVFAGPSR